MFHTTFDSPLGPLVAVGDGQALHGLYMREGRMTIACRPGWTEDERPFRNVQAQLGEYFDGDRHTFDLELALYGSTFERRVWDALLEIPYGHTASYGEIAARLGERASPRAVGVANARNPVCVIVPCHRVIGADGSLVGYGGGLGRKRLLLELEAGVVPLAA